MYGNRPDVNKVIEGTYRNEMANTMAQQGLSDAVQRQQQEAQLHPLIMDERRQRARALQLESDLAEKQQPGKLREIEYKNQKAEYEDLDRFGQALEQWGSIAEANGGQIPLPLQGRMPPQLASMFSQPDGWKQAKSAGAAMRENSMKWLQQASKQGSAEEIAALKAEVEANKEAGRNKRAAEANEMRVRIANLMASKKAGDAEKARKTMDEAFVYYNEKAATARDPEERAFYTQQAQEIVNQKSAYIVLQAAAKAAGSVDTGAVTDLPTRPTPTSRTVNPPSKTQPQAASTQATTSGRVRVQSADGKIGSIPASQLQDALKQGFKEIK